ncbi:MAG: DUF3050 domain-containing protein, partial [Planctomycetota bacterium]
LLKRLQKDLSCVQTPWIPVRNPVLARFINEINLGEETDITPNGEVLSHLELYVNAMKEVGANTLQFNSFLDRIRQNGNVPYSLEVAEIPDFVKQFVRATMHVVQHGSTLDVATFFLLGREDPIPMMFQRILDHWPKEQQAPQFIYYLKRHIQVDGESHGPLAEKMLMILLKEEKERTVDSLLPIAREAIQKRIDLWDGILQRVQSRSEAVPN